MMRSLFSGVSGLKSHQTRMDVIGNNIANVNTVGFKASRTTFADTLSQTQSGASRATGTIGGTNPKQIGLGVSVASIDMPFTDASPQATGKNTDVALSGDGLFVVKNGDQVYYTRDGAFEFDEEGTYVLPGSGLIVQGWMNTSATDHSTIDTNGAVVNIQIPSGKPMGAQVTSTADYTGNLNANSGTTGITTTITAFDDEGYSYSVPVIFNKTAANTWALALSGTAGATSVDLVDSTGAVVGTAELTADDLKFTEAGRYDSGTATLKVKPDPTARDSAVGSEFEITIDLSQLTQYANESTLHPESNGNASGTLASVAIDRSGVITGTYTNGVRRSEAQIAIAQFNNASGLTKTSGSLYQESNNSGAANIKTATALGVIITPSALEMSNVDIANEFADMIVTQRGFQSNSKIITVGDEMIETVINMKR